MDYRIKYLTTRYLRASLKDGEAEELAKLISESEENRSYFRKTVASLSKDCTTTPEAFSFWNSFRHKNRRSFNRRDSGRKYLFWPVAAAVALCVAAGAVFLSRGTQSPKEEEVLASAPVQPKETVYKASGVTHITLSDGSKVVLNSNSTLTVSALFGESLREVTLDGEAFFDVAKDTSRLFVVKCNKESYIVRGTSFNITSWSEDKLSIVTLHTGSLEARVGADIIKLSPGEELQVDESAENYAKRRVRNVEESAVWIKSDEIIFDDKPLKVVALRIAKKYGVHIEVAPQLENILYTGKSGSETLPELFRLLELTSPVPIRITGQDGEYQVTKI